MTEQTHRTDRDLGKTYRFEEDEKTKIGLQEQTDPTHRLHFGTDLDDYHKHETYYVEVAGSTVELLMHRTSSSRTYQKHQMFPVELRKMLEDDGYEVIDGSENIRFGTVDRVIGWLSNQGIDPDDVRVAVSKQHCSVTIGVVGYLEGESWDQFIGTMRSNDLIQFAESQKLHYIEDSDIPELLNDD